MKSVILLLSIFILNGFLTASTSVEVEVKDRVIIDFEMVDKGIQWLEFINTGAKEEAIKNYFMSHVAPTKGCQSIIHHWARFKEWNNEIFYRFIMIALDRIPADEKIKNEDGSLTSLGTRRMLWMKALQNPGQLKQDLAELKAIDFCKESLLLAKQFLPEKAVLEADFYFVLFGHSTAFSVGKENGFDFLQLAKLGNGKIDIQVLTRTFAHELHHTGFEYLMKQNLKDVKKEENILLVGILAGEGMPTYFIDQPWKNLEEYKASKNPSFPQVAEDWEKHSARLNELYKEAEADLSLNLEGKKSQAELMGRWMSGMKGAAYVLGADMIGVIDKYLGRELAVGVALDYRNFLMLYNQAARTAVTKGDNVYIFSQDLARRISQYTGEE